MKFVLKETILVKVFLLLVLPVSLKAQSTEIPYGKYVGKMITTTAAINTKPLVIVEFGGDIPESMKSGDFIKKDRQTWSTSFTKKSDGLNLIRELKRIEVSAPGPTGLREYDSDSSFESINGAEGLVESKLKALKKNISYLSKSNEWESKDATKDDLEKIWIDNFPILGNEAVIQGLFFSGALPKNSKEGTKWEETILRPESEITNTYTIERKEGNQLTINLVSKQIFLNKNKLNDFTLKPVQKTLIKPVAAKLGNTTIAKKYEGKITIDAATLFISKMDMDITTETYTMHDNFSTPRTRNATLLVTNSF